MLQKAFIIVVSTLAYIYLLTNIFEYCLNEASSTALTTAGVILFIILTLVYISLIYRFSKKRSDTYD